MYTLFIDTHFKNINLCLFKDNIIINNMVVENPSSTSECTMPSIIELLKNNTEPQNIKNFIVCIGPGSFTGIRIGLSIAKTFAYLNDASIYTINSLELAALNNRGKNIYGVKENNGLYLAEFYDQSMVSEIKYLKNSEYETSNYKDKVIYNDIVDYQKLIDNYKKLNKSDYYNVSPLYVKTISALEKRDK